MNKLMSVTQVTRKPTLFLRSLVLIEYVLAVWELVLS